MFVLHNSLIVPEYMFQINYKNRAFQYGDGFFETMVYQNGDIRFFDDHYKRICEACDVFSFETGDRFTQEKLRENLIGLVEKNSLGFGARVKLMIYRSEGGFFTPDINSCEVLATAVEHRPNKVGEKHKVEFYDEYPVQFSPTSSFKTLSALPYVFAGVFAKKLALDDVIILNESGKVAECLYTNIYWVKDGVLYTPSLKTGCVSGVMRKQVLAAANAQSIKVQEGEYVKEDVLDADFVFNSNVTGLFVIQHIEGASFKGGHPVFESLKSELFTGA